jgi:hypothetical protein
MIYKPWVWWFNLKKFDKEKKTRETLEPLICASLEDTGFTSL